MSGDFDPRILWDRRQVLAGIGAGAFAAGLPVSAFAAPEGAPLLITGADIGAEAAQALAYGAGAYLVPMPPQTDALRFWSAQIAPNLKGRMALIGVTHWADALVLTGAAAEARLRVRFATDRQAAADPAFSELADRLRETLAAVPPSGPARIGWILA
jgi:hypothetical protein